MSPAHHITLPDLMVTYSGDDWLESLSVATRLQSRPLMFLWRHDMPPRVEEISRDPTYGLETSQEVPRASFPAEAVIKQIQANPHEFPDDIGTQIIRLLEASRS